MHKTPHACEDMLLFSWPHDTRESMPCLRRAPSLASTGRRHGRICFTNGVGCKLFAGAATITLLGANRVSDEPVAPSDSHCACETRRWLDSRSFKPRTWCFVNAHQSRAHQIKNRGRPINNREIRTNSIAQWQAQTNGMTSDRRATIGSRAQALTKRSCSRSRSGWRQHPAWQWPIARGGAS